MIIHSYGAVTFEERLSARKFHFIISALGQRQTWRGRGHLVTPVAFPAEHRRNLNYSYNIITYMTFVTLCLSLIMLYFLKSNIVNLVYFRKNNVEVVRDMEGVKRSLKKELPENVLARQPYFPLRKR